MLKACALLLIPFGIAAQQWSRVDDFPGTKRDDGTAAVLNGTAYFGTGLQEGWTSTEDWYALDLYTLRWEQIINMPPNTGRQYACAFTALNSVFVFGGDAYGGRNDMYRYDPHKKAWFTCASRPGKGVMAAACFTFGDKAYFMGGKVHHDSLPNAEVWEYNATNDTWQQKKDLPYPARWRAAAASLGPFGYLAGGVAAGDVILNDFLVYDPGTDTWQQHGELPVMHPVKYATLQALTNKLVLFGGQDSLGTFSNALWYYRPVQNDWQQGPDLPSFGRRGGMAYGWNEKLVYSCGLGPGDIRLNETWMLDLPLGNPETGPHQVKVYPNPCSDVTNIVPESGRFDLTVLTADGRIFERIEDSDKGVQLQTADWPPGIYILEIKDQAGNKHHARLVRE